MAKYEDLGVSPHKPDVMNALIGIDQGLFPKAFCKAVPDIFTGSDEHCVLLHADGAGTKSSLAYLQYKETGDPSIFEKIAQDSLVMNLDDLLCVGATGPFLLSNTIGRDAKIIGKEIVKALIHGYEKQINVLREYGVVINSCGGETADVGDLVRTVIVDATVFTRMKKEDFIDCSNVKPGQDIVGFASFGQAIYETEYNSGIGTNGFTTARHKLLNKDYREFTESYSPEIANLAYSGSFNLSDRLEGTNLTVGEALLSPTRTYSPVIQKILPKYKKHISAIFNNTGGGQTKCLNFGENIKYHKNNLFDFPPVFKLLKEKTDLSYHEFYRVFNVGHRLEIVCDQSISNELISIANDFGIAAQVIGQTSVSDKRRELIIVSPEGEVVYTHS